MRLQYYGTSLDPEQIQHIESLGYNPSQPHVFFGRTLDHGVRGFITPTSHHITLLATDSEIEKNDMQKVHMLSFKEDAWSICDLRFTSSDNVLISSISSANSNLENGIVTDLPSLSHLAMALCGRGGEDTLQCPKHDRIQCDFAPTQWCTNATTFTALDSNGKVCEVAATPQLCFYTSIKLSRLLI